MLPKSKYIIEIDDVYKIKKRILNVRNFIRYVLWFLEDIMLNGVKHEQIQKYVLIELCQTTFLFV